jgi:hypothetical protein
MNLLSGGYGDDKNYDYNYNTPEPFIRNLLEIVSKCVDFLRNACPVNPVEFPRESIDII